MSENSKSFLGINLPEEPIEIKGAKRVSIFIFCILLLFAVGYVVGWAGYHLVN